MFCDVPVKVCVFWVLYAEICAKNINHSNENHTCSGKGYSILVWLHGVLKYLTIFTLT